MDINVSQREIWASFLIILEGLGFYFFCYKVREIIFTIIFFLLMVATLIWGNGGNLSFLINF